MTCERHGSFRNVRARANRLILSRLDPSLRIGADAIGIIADEIKDEARPWADDCADCWQDIAVYVAALAAEHLVEACGFDEDDAESWEAAEAEAIAATEDRIANALDK